MDAVLKQMSDVYTATFFGLIIVLAVAEWFVPRRGSAAAEGPRLASNFGISLLNNVAVRAVFPATAIGWAALCAQRGWGLFAHTAWPAPVEFLTTILALDLLLYGRHYLLHRVPILWRLHRTHHSDRDYDFTTGIRFHPLEEFFTTTLELGLILALGAPAAAVFLSRLLSMTVSLVEHANLRIPSSLDRIVRTVLVTPDMHRIHHSQAPGDNRSNLSTAFSWWDRVFGTYREHPAAGEAAIEFGLREFPEGKHSTLPWMLAQPFLANPADAAAHNESTEPAALRM
jgi:sterol desaturase/sphingolipid hydroxylase (fatty acid hydroxylase superfamily)